MFMKETGNRYIQYTFLHIEMIGQEWSMKTKEKTPKLSYL